MTDDELAPFRTDPLLVALTAPAEPVELAGEDAAIAIFRSTAGPFSRRGRLLRLTTLGGAGVALGLAMTGGVAAAYTSGLPAPMQQVVHDAIAPFGIPAPAAPPPSRPRHDRQRVTHVPRPTPAVALPAPLAHPTAAASPRPSTSPVAVAPTAAAPAPSPTPSPTATVRPTFDVAVSRRAVPIHGAVMLSGRLTRGDAPLGGQTVFAAARPAGSSTWQRVASGTTAADGTVSLSVSPLTINVRLRLVAPRLATSAERTVIVIPKLTVAISRAGNDRLARITTDGGAPGDTLVLLRRDGSTWTQIDSTTLGSDGAASFTVPGPAATRVDYRVRLAPTRQHGAGYAQFSVRAR